MITMLHFPRFFRYLLLVPALATGIQLPVFSDNAMLLKSYLPGYRVRQLFPRDIKGKTMAYSMAPFSRINDWRKDEIFPGSYDLSCPERLLSRFDEILYFALNPSSLDDPEVLKELEGHLSFLQRITIPKLVLTLNGSSEDYIPLCRNKKALQSFFVKLGVLVDKYQLGGVDLDWEFPASKDEKELYTLFLKDLQSFCNKREKSLSIAVSRFRALPEECYTMAQQIHLMCYDFYGRHSTVESTKEAMAYMASRYNIPESKLIMGIPYYGRIFDGNSPGYWHNSLPYREIVQEHDILKGDNQAGGYYFNGIDAVAEKASMAKTMGGGCFIWEIGQDSLGDKSLTGILFRELDK